MLKPIGRAIGMGVEALKGPADTSHVHLRARDESGFGMLELLMAMVMLNVGILAIVGAFSSGNVALARASRISTAAALANKQMEVYRGLKYDNILFVTSEWNSATADSTYTSDVVYQQNMASPTPPKALVPTVTTCPANVPSTACDPSYTTTGADHKSYRVDTYLYFDAPTGGNQLKTISVVVRNGDGVSQTYARATSTFDPSTGQCTTPPC
jgi:type II secretory pathway pseudopilin PulG